MSFVGRYFLWCPFLGESFNRGSTVLTYVCTACTYVSIYICTYVCPNTILCLCSAPSAPRNLTSVNITTTSFAVTWAVPANPNGVVTTYNVEISTGGRVLQATNTSQTEFTFPQLDPVVKYTVSVCAYTLSCGSVATLTVETNGGVYCV